MKKNLDTDVLGEATPGFTCSQPLNTRGNDSTPIANAVAKLGGQTETTRKLVAAGLVRSGKMSPQNVWNWIKSGHCPPRYAAWIERHTGIPRKLLVAAEYSILLRDPCDKKN